MKRRPLRRILAAAVLLIIIIGAFPVTNLPALAADYSIDGTGFADIKDNVEEMTVYIWHKGKPPATVDGTLYPTLITWDGQYYIKGGQSGKTNFDKYYDTWYRAEEKGDGEKYYVDDFLALEYQQWRNYGKSSVSELPLNFRSLWLYDTAISFTLPEVPYLVATKNTTTPSYSNERDSRYAIILSDEGMASKTADDGSMKDQKVYSFLRAYLQYYAWIKEAWFMGYYDDWVYQDADFLLEAKSGFSLEEWTADKQLTYRYRFASHEKPGDSDRNWYNRTSSCSLAERTWRIRLENVGKYSISTVGQTVDYVTRRSSAWQLANNEYFEDAIKSWKGNMSLYHGKDTNLFSYGWTGKGTGDVKNMYIGSPRVWDDTVTKKYMVTDTSYDTFDLYYATPMPMSILKGDFTVKNGQTTNLNGPIVIDTNVTITVEDGGVLSCTGWVVNNGRIKVKPGGTLIINEDEAGTDGVICTNNSTPNMYAGVVACDGTIIVMPNCELCCGGKLGLALGCKAQVVNYGSVIADNFVANGDYLIENRSAASGVYIGYDVIDGGFTLTATNPKVSGKTVEYPGKGTIQPSSTSIRMPNTVYGKYAGNLYQAEGDASHNITTLVDPGPRSTADVTGGNIPLDRQ